MEGELFLRERFSELLSWERIKRREKIVVAAFFYSILASVAALPAKALLPSWVTPLSLPLVFFLILAPAFFLLRPGRSKESLQAVFLLDKALHLEERAITAWDILARKQTKPPELLVLKEAGEKITGIDVRALLKRHRTWHVFFAPPLLLVWLLLIWIDIGVHLEKGLGRTQLASVAQKLREFALGLEERARSEGLKDSLKVAHALRDVAEKSVRGEMSEKKLSKDLAGIVGKIEVPVDQTVASDLFSMAPRQGLLDLKAELELFKSFAAPDAHGQEDRLGPEFLQRLSALPRLSEEIEKLGSSVEKLGGKELRRVLDKIERDVGTELDRRTLLEIKEFLELLLKGIGGEENQVAVHEAAPGEEDPLSRPQRIRRRGDLPGDQAGAKDQPPQAPSPSLKSGAATHLKGLLGEGRSGSLAFRGESAAQESKIPQEEVLTSYRRRAEEDLASESIPEGLKDAIKRYFLSLGMSEEKK